MLERRVRWRVFGLKCKIVRGSWGKLVKCSFMTGILYKKLN
jgi:hypothetical protein